MAWASVISAAAPTTARARAEGATDLEPYRKDGRAMIREFEAWEKAGHHMDGNAARVLDYAATWVPSYLDYDDNRALARKAVLDALKSAARIRRYSRLARSARTWHSASKASGSSRT